MTTKPSYEKLEFRVKELETQLGIVGIKELMQSGHGVEANLVQHMLHEVHFWELVRDNQGEIKSWRLIYANPAALHSWKKDLCDVIGKNTEDIFTDGDPVGQFLPIVKKICGDQKPYIWEQYFPATKQVLKMVSVPYGDCFISTGLDISKQKMAEEALNQSRKLESIGQLVNGIAHDFNNQLTAIIGYADILIDQTVDEKLIIYAESISRAAKSSAELTSKLVDFSSTGHINLVPLSPDEVIDQTIDLIRPSINNNISIVREFHAPDIKIQADQKQIQTALLNIALNAQSAMPDGGDLIFQTEMVILEKNSELVTSHNLPIGKYLRLTVSDTGHGIPPDIKHRLFEPFFSTKPSGEGLGMGLASAYGIIKRHGGTIIVESEEKKGASFHLYLAVDSVSEKINEVANNPASPLQLLSSYNILLVDDEELIRNMGSQILSILGHEVQTASGGPEALDLYRKNHQDIHLVILDMTMPNMDGLSVFRELKLINKDVKVLVASGYSKEGRIKTLLDEGGCGFLAKPYTKTQLVEAIKNCFA